MAQKGVGVKGGDGVHLYYTFSPPPPQLPMPVAVVGAGVLGDGA